MGAADRRDGAGRSGRPRRDGGRGRAAEDLLNVRRAVDAERRRVPGDCLTVYALARTRSTRRSPTELDRRRSDAAIIRTCRAAVIPRPRQTAIDNSPYERARRLGGRFRSQELGPWTMASGQGDPGAVEFHHLVADAEGRQGLLRHQTGMPIRKRDQGNLQAPASGWAAMSIPFLGCRETGGMASSAKGARLAYVAKVYSVLLCSSATIIGDFTTSLITAASAERDRPSALKRISA